jgi:hypothetical protein
VESQFRPNSSSLGVLARAGTIGRAPVDLRGPFRPAEPSTLLSNCVGFSRTVPVGASEKCAKGFNEVHMPCTTFPQAQELCKSKEKCRFCLRKSLFARDGKYDCTVLVQSDLRKTQ